MHKTSSEAATLVNTIKAGVKKFNETEIVVCPPFTALEGVAKEVSSSNVELGAQNMYPKTEGAFTGEVSPLMLKDIGCRYVILGHSERREYFGETDAVVREKLLTALDFNLIPIVCIGETLGQRESGEMENVLRTQLVGAFEGLDAKLMEKVVIAYEPVWAIGTGKTATPDQADQAHAFIRKVLVELFSGEIAEDTQILYGGSVKPENIRELIVQDNIDGALVGGASLKGESFIQLVEAAETEKDEETITQVD